MEIGKFLMIYSLTVLIKSVNSWPSLITFFYSIFGLRKPLYLTDKCITTNLPDNACSLSLGFEVAAWPPYSRQMFFLFQDTCNAIVDKRIFRRKPFIKFVHANEVINYIYFYQYSLNFNSES